MPFVQQHHTLIILGTVVCFAVLYGLLMGGGESKEQIVGANDNDNENPEGGDSEDAPNPNKHTRRIPKARIPKNPKIAAKVDKSEANDLEEPAATKAPKKRIGKPAKAVSSADDDLEEPAVTKAPKKKVGKPAKVVSSNDDDLEEPAVTKAPKKKVGKPTKPPKAEEVPPTTAPGASEDSETEEEKKQPKVAPPTKAPKAPKPAKKPAKEVSLDDSVDDPAQKATAAKPKEEETGMEDEKPTTAPPPPAKRLDRTQLYYRHTGGQCLNFTMFTHWTPLISSLCGSAAAKPYPCFCDWIEMQTAKCGVWSTGTWSPEYSKVLAGLLKVKRRPPSPVEAAPCSSVHWRNRFFPSQEARLSKESANTCSADGQCHPVDRFTVEPACAPQTKYFTVEQALTLLHQVAEGQPIVISGDSIMRQFFSRLVFFLRGSEDAFDKITDAGHDSAIWPLIESPFQNDARYVITTEGDQLMVGATDAPVTIGGGLLLDVRFFWDIQQSIGRAGFPPSPVPASAVVTHAVPEPRPYLYFDSAAAGEFNMPTTSVHVHSFAYWWASADETNAKYLTVIHDAIKGYIDSLNLGAPLGPSDPPIVRRHYVYILPPLPPPYASSATHSAAKKLKKYSGKMYTRNIATMDWCQRVNREIVSWVAEKRGASSTSTFVPVTVSCLDFNGLSFFVDNNGDRRQQQGYNLRCDDLHFMGGYAPLGPEHMITQQKKDCGGGCRDDANLALAQWLIRTLSLL